MRLVGYATVLLWVAAPGSVSAQASTEELARAHFESASAYYEQGRYDDAEREFMESYRLSRRPELLLNAAQAQERAERYDDALRTLRRILDDHPDYGRTEVVHERIARVEASRASTRQPASDGGADRAPSEDGGGLGELFLPGVIVLAGGGLLGLVTIITGAASQSIYDDLQGACADGCPPERQGDVDTGEALGTTATALFFPTIIALGVGATLVVLDLTSGGGDGQAALELTPGPGDAGVALRGRF